MLKWVTHPRCRSGSGWVAMFHDRSRAASDRMGTAEIEDAHSTVALSGAAGKAWSRRFEGVLALLGPGGHSWGEIKLTKKDAIEGRAVGEGSGADLRHFLESVVLEVNSNFESGAVSPPDRPEDHDRRAAGARDAKMTATFRAFAGEEAEAGAEDWPGQAVLLARPRAREFRLAESAFAARLRAADGSRAGSFRGLSSFSPAHGSARGSRRARPLDREQSW